MKFILSLKNTFSKHLYICFAKQKVPYGSAGTTMTIIKMGDHALVSGDIESLINKFGEPNESVVRKKY